MLNKHDGIFDDDDIKSGEILGIICGNVIYNSLEYTYKNKHYNKCYNTFDLLITLQMEMSSASLPITIISNSNKLIDADKCNLFLYDNAHQALYQMQGSVSLIFITI